MDRRLLSFCFVALLQCAFAVDPPQNPPSRPCADASKSPCFEAKTNDKGEEKCVRKPNCCPKDVTKHNCLLSPCHYQQTNCPKARFCIEDYCGGCHAHYYDDEWNELTGEQCKDAGSDPKIVRCSPRSETGSGKAAMKRFAYDRVYGYCREFTYGGVGGNENNFKTKEECESFCAGVPPCPIADLGMLPPGCRHTMPDEPAPDGCFYPTVVCEKKDEGSSCDANPCPPCHDCEPKAGNQGFCCTKKTDCAGPVPIRTAPADVNSPVDPAYNQRMCRQDADPGPCQGKTKRWYFDKHYARCDQFDYGGCDGNNNNFITQTECIQQCGLVRPCPMLSVSPAPTGCRWSFKHSLDGCTVPLLQCAGTGGCQKDSCAKCEVCDNEFDPKCHDVYCKPIGHKCTRDRLCERLACESTSCEEAQSCQFDREKGAVCEYNLDQLETLRICRLPSDTGPCRARKEMYHWDPVYARCDKFVYGGCKGNENRFATSMDCMTKCGSTRPCPMHDIMQTPPGCFAGMYTALDGCRYQFANCTDIGCGPNPCKECEICKNVYEDKCDSVCKPSGHKCDKDPICEKWKCDKQNCPPGTLCVFGEKGAQCETAPTPDVDTQRKCRLPKSVGKCKALVERWYYDSNDGQCKTFNWGGCDPNENNFVSKDDCEETCTGVTGCVLPPPKETPPGCRQLLKLEEDGCFSVEIKCETTEGEKRWLFW